MFPGLRVNRTRPPLAVAAIVSLPPAEVLGATLLLLAISAAAIALRTRAPYVVTGWLWFLGTLVPVIGIVALGAQSMADRYSYFSYIGLFFAIASELIVPTRRFDDGGKDNAAVKPE